MLTYTSASIHPLKMQIPDMPCLIIAAHTCTFVGYFGLGFTLVYGLILCTESPMGLYLHNSLNRVDAV